MELVKGQNIGLVFFDKSRLSTPYYFVKAVHISTGAVVAWEITDTADDSSGLYRVVADFTEGSDATLVTGEHELYLYDQEASGNTTVSDSTNLIDRVVLKVLPATESDAPAADFSADDTTPSIGQVVTFTDSSTKIPTSWAWEFTPATVTYVSGTSATSQNPKVTFDSVGSYTAKLTSTNAGGSDSETKSSYITAASIPVADFSADDTTPTTSQTVTLTDTSTNTPTSWAWAISGGNYTLMNGSVLSDQNIDIRFDDVASYNIQLTATNIGGSGVELKSAYISTAQGFQNIYSMDFDGVSQYAAMSSSSHMDIEYTQAWTFSIWAKFDSDGIAAYILSKRDGGLKRGFILLRNTSNQIEVYMQNSATYLIRVGTIETILAASGWNHIAVTYSGGGLLTNFEIYINGVQATKNVFTNNLGGRTIQNSANFQVSTVLDGHLTQLGYFSKVLSAADVNTGIYNGGTPLDLRLHSEAADLDLYNQLGVGGDYDTTAANEWYLPDLINSDFDLTGSATILASRTNDVP